MKFQYIYQIEDFDNLENSTKYEKITELEIIFWYIPGMTGTSM